MVAKTFKSTVIFAGMLSLVACVTTGNKERIGSVSGGVLGGVIASQVAGKNKGLWVAAGILVGSYIGNKLGKYLDDEDRNRMATATDKALKSGSLSKWSNDKSKTSGQANVLATKSENESLKVAVLKDKIKHVPPLDVIGETYRSKSASNLRGGPGSDYVKVGSLLSGQIVNVIGKVQDQPWYLISQEGVGSGFIYAPLLESAPTAKITPTTNTIAKTDVAEQQVDIKRVCRTVEQSITLADGTTHQETIEACQSPNGWEMKT